jgi:hypothetical protein
MQPGAGNCRKQSEKLAFGMAILLLEFLTKPGNLTRFASHGTSARAKWKCNSYTTETAQDSDFPGLPGTV